MICACIYFMLAKLPGLFIEEDVRGILNWELEARLLGGLLPFICTLLPPGLTDNLLQVVL